ncbi:carbamoyltransferase family protein [Burkholderia diffusa]|uniref:carbamoyltransferase family protein n=1 Tax=Burkholderia diffusa TaxID=488732 RepID=UPI00157B46DE|nr:carbamoyltransferase C-terminal domain-containing protein [Burkholderia diffusa]NTY37442.1 hypothetical protein [Burkholderia diffusa]
MDDTIYGISCLGHDAALAVIRGDRILFAAHAERYSKIKNDALLNDGLLDDALSVAGPPTRIVFHERPWRTRVCHAYAGQWRKALARSPIAYIRSFDALAGCPVSTVGHHEAHAAAGMFTAPFDEAAVVVIDAIGEWDTVSIWHGQGTRLQRVFVQRYPHSLGLFYAALTQRCGLKPNEEEFIMMAMAALGEPVHRDAIVRELIRPHPRHFRLRRNVHRGLGGWHPEWREPEHIAASAQAIAEDALLNLMTWVVTKVPSRNLVLAGGFALNCVANEKLCRSGLFDRLWIMPNPGDAGNALGAALASSKRPMRWDGPYLGHELGRGANVQGALAALQDGRIAGFAHGRAEYGPRALGNRSLLADPREPRMKDRVNEVKRREPFRPFAPAIPAELAGRFFDLPVPASPYMQVTGRCRFPERFPAVCHVDGSSRVQTVDAAQNAPFHELLMSFYRSTGCPMLLNTSLNVKGMPIANDQADIDAFTRETGIEVF